MLLVKVELARQRDKAKKKQKDQKIGMRKRGEINDGRG